MKYGTACLVFCVSVLPNILCHVSRHCAPTQQDQENLNKLVAAINGLAVNLYKTMAADSTENVFFSPFSISAAFEMLFYGTGGDSAEELREALGYRNATLPKELVHRTFQQLLCSVQAASSATDAYDLDIANAILVKDTLPVFPAYRDEVKRLYQADIENVDMSPAVVRKINNWVNEKTKGKIQKIVDSLSVYTVMVLLNAVYFKGTWESEFNEHRTRPQTFYNYGMGPNRTDVSMMHLTSLFLYGYHDDCKVLQLPYKGDNVDMLIILPHRRDGLRYVEEGLTAQKWSDIQNRMYRQKVIIHLPKFKFEYEREMSSDFQKLGARKIFTEEADFSGMTHPTVRGMPLFVSKCPPQGRH